VKDAANYFAAFFFASFSSFYPLFNVNQHIAKKKGGNKIA